MDGDGKTKFFDIDCLDFLLKLIALHAKQSKQTLILKKGIKSPHQDDRKKTANYMLKKYTNECNELNENINNVVKNLDILMRFCGVSMRHTA